MTINYKNLILSSACFFFIACSSESKKETTETSTSNRPAYDLTKTDPNAKVVELTIVAQGEDMSKMSFDMKSMKVSSGTTIKLTIKSTSPDASMPHNWVLVHKGTMELVAMAGLQAGRELGFVPNSPDVLVHSKLLGPGEEQTLTFSAPPPGVYEYVCTYPGHWSIMNGVLTVE